MQHICGILYISDVLHINIRGIYIQYLQKLSINIYLTSIGCSKGFANCTIGTNNIFNDLIKELHNFNRMLQVLCCTIFNDLIKELLLVLIPGHFAGLNSLEDFLHWLWTLATIWALRWILQELLPQRHQYW